MSKNLLVVILGIVAFAALVFAWQQKSKAGAIVAQCETEKQQLEQLAAQQRREAEEFQKIAQLAQHEAMVQRTLCEEQLKQAYNKK
ncbi:MAG: hypothetical protein JNJ65_04155 [Cyclobacteriaceae bacterium]|nr:hypothetical protein [Cyclobacteriaceae bacterium]